MKANHDKCHLLMSTLTPISIKVKDFIIKIVIMTLKTAHEGYAKFIYQMLVSFNFLSLYLFEIHSGTVH